MMMTGSALGYLSGNELTVEGFRPLGYPDYFRMLLGMAKPLSGVALLAPPVPVTLREWAYAGFGSTLVVAAVWHGDSRDSIEEVVAPLVALVPLAVVQVLWPRAGRTPRRSSWAGL
jgi:hypothetical protein